MQKIKMPIIVSVIAITLVTTALGMGTMAWFSDTETSTGNVFTAGTMDITLGTLTITSGDLSNMAPGDIVTGTLYVENTGSLDGYLYGRSSYTKNGQGDGSDLGDVLRVTSWTEPSGTYTPNMLLTHFVAQTGVVLDGYGGTWMPYGSLAPSAGTTFGITIKFDTDAGNIYQTDTLTMTFEILLHQENIT